MSNYWEFRSSAGSTDANIIHNVIDGDTIEMTVDLGFGVTRRIKLRLDGVDTAETHNTSHGSEEYEKGNKQANFVRDWLIEAMEESDTYWYLHLETEKGERSFTRWIGDIRRKSDGEWLVESIIEEWPEAEYDH